LQCLPGTALIDGTQYHFDRPAKLPGKNYRAHNRQPPLTIDNIL
jgi:hypothetical protein